MAAASRGTYKRMYSWWWDSHISPKNSKLLQENLTDMDVKVKHMIKLLEEDGDSFAKKAEMYYKKRPELMKLVEEFYRAYRALAERYDHATGVLRQAHRTMAEAFPNQVPLDESPSDTDPRTPEMNYLEESDSFTRRKGSKHFDELFGSGEGQTKCGEGRARKGLHFQDVVEKEQNNGSYDRVEKDDSEISSLKKVLAKLEAEKEASLVQYRESLGRISKLELEVSNEQESSSKLNDRARKAEDEVKVLKESLEKLETECKTSLLRYQQSLDKMSNLETEISRVEKDGIKLSELASKSETEVEDLKQELSRVEAEKEAALVQHQQCLEKISNLEKKLSQAEEDARKYNEKADKTESELITLREALKKLKEENEAEALKYQECMEKIASLELTINYEAERLQLEIDNGIAKIKGAEEKCLSLERSNQTLQFELDSLMLKVGQQNQELTEKQQELGSLWSGMQEEHSRFVEAETAFQTLQHLHLKSEEKLKLLGAEIQNRDQTLKNLESHNQSLDDQVQKVMGENMALNELKLSSALSIKNLQDEISRLKVTIGNIEAEVELRVNERNALQQEIYCLKEEINDLNKKNGAMIIQVKAVGYEPDCFESSVTELQAENKTLKANFEEERSEKEGLLQKLAVMKELLDKNVFLENSISDMNVEIEELREKVKLLEGSCQFLMEEKATLVAEKDILTSHLQTTTENLEKLTNKSTFLENSLSDANAELEEFRTKAKSLEDLCLLLDKEKSGLITERENVQTELENSISVMNVKTEELREKAKLLEGSCQFLMEEKATLVTEKDILTSHLQTTTKNLEKLTNKSMFLENALSDANAKLEELRTKAKSLEDLCLLLDKEKSGLMTERENVQTELENSISDMNAKIEELREKEKLLEESCQFLMEENATLVTEKDILTSHLQTTTENLEKLTNKSMFLENSLSDANSELEEFRTKAKSLQDLCLLLDKEKSGLITERENVQTELEASQKLLKDAKERFAELEGTHSVLFREKESSLRDIESLQSSLDSKKEEHANFAELSKTRLADLELQNRFLREEGQDWKNQFEEELNRAINSHMEIFILQKCLQDMEEKSLALQLERQELLEASIQSDKSISELERGNFEKDLLAKTSAETITMLRSGLQDMENSLLHLCDKKYRLTIEKFVIEELLEQLRLEAGSIMAERNTLDQELRMQNEVFCKVSEMNEELRSKVAEGEIKEENLISEMENLSRKLHNLEEEHQNLQAENFKALDENCLLAKAVQHLKDENFYMMSELTYQTQLSLIFREIISEKCEELKDLGDNLDKLRFMNGEHEENVRNLEGKLGGFQIENLKLEKSLEKSLKGLHKEEERQVLMEKEKTELHNMFDQLKAKNNEFMEIQEDQGKKMLKLSDDNDRLAKETLFLHEMKHNLEGEVQNLQEEMEQKKIKNETLSDELEKNKSEVQLWETQAAEFLSELQISVVREVLFSEKIHEFAEAFESLQEKCDSKEKELEIHAERRSSLEEEIERLNIELGSYIPAIKSLNNSITSMEEHTIKSKVADKREGKDSDLVKCDTSESCAQKYDDRISSLPSGSYELQGLLQRLLAIELAVIEAEKLSTKEKLNAKDEMKYGDALPRENGDISRPATPQQIESGAGNEVSTKDIVLDQNSECSSFGISRKETSEVDDHMLADYHLIKACKKPHSKHSSTESLVEKELGVDKLEISSRFSEPDPEVRKRKIIEGLEADAIKLTNLQTTVQDLKRKMEGKAKNRKGKVSEYDSLKGKLEEAEEAITRLFDMNRKLTKNAQDDTLSGDQNSFSGPDELGRIRSRRISEQARKGSEKIGRLQLEMDKLQFILLKLEDEIQMRDRARARAVDRKQRVLLRDYLYGRTKGRPKSKRSMFCACLNPPTGED